ncbi:HAMP domain-containing histidine kinase [Dechloromonas sp. XY25]|uniref:histidine kinase n=1 Tax=Dechloromonas hankyongensis TaxID=2908002 RepID=A0ABS9K7P2_9RHOO|nr:ATP-binding protein [Dechloromonas hankyongensis]MCG2579183.1 HAMP domain-containing histidine kinase [Dechloromonas hankyongensis]
MNDVGFDHEWHLGELLDTPALSRIGPALGELLGGDAALLDYDETLLWGVLAADARRQPVILELEPIGFVASRTAAPATLAAGARLVTALLRAELRFKMASTLHLEAVAADFESLKREHAHLLESEARYRKLSEELEARVKTQVAELEERQQMLYEAEKLASVGQLAAGMAHEINNPLGFVRSNLSTFKSYLDKFGQLKARLAEGEAGWQALDLDFVLEDGADLLGESAKGIDRIARIVSDLKSFSNIDRPTDEYADLNNCLRHASSIVDTQLPPGINLSLDLLPLPSLICLPGHLNQLFFNLIRNAVQAIQDAERPGTVRIGSFADDSGITITIHDDGKGMTAEQCACAFQPFYTTRTVGMGAGLGLTTARNIVLAHSGRIDLASTPNVGTTVTLFFPTPT